MRERLLGQPPQPQAPLTVEPLRPLDATGLQDHNIDPAIAGPGMNAPATGGSGAVGMGGGVAVEGATAVAAPAMESPEAIAEQDVDGAGKKASKRALQDGKRAAQNRAAQVSVDPFTLRLIALSIVVVVLSCVECSLLRGEVGASDERLSNISLINFLLSVFSALSRRCHQHRRQRALAYVNGLFPFIASLPSQEGGIYQNPSGSGQGQAKGRG